MIWRDDMIYIKDRSEDNFRELLHSNKVFHEALGYVTKGEKRFHVKNEKGNDYDLVYKENNSFFLEKNGTAMKFDSDVLPPYLHYDEYCSDKFYLDMFDGYDRVVFEEADEYTIVMAQVLLRETDLEIVFLDERSLWFIEPSDRFSVGAAGRDSGLEKKTFTCCKEDAVNGGVDGSDPSFMSTVILFHNMFIWQWMTDLPMKNVKYASVIVLKTEGIGAVLDHFTRMRNAFAGKGIQTYLKSGSTRFPDKMLGKFFSFDMLPDDADESNTIYINNFLPLRASLIFYKSDAHVRTDMLSSSFLKEIDEYYNGVFGDQKVLGVLIRGTDYINLKLDGIRKQATPQEMMPVIDKWMAEDGYERIFLATEDADILDVMYDRYGDKLVAIAQERHRLSDFKEGQYLSDVEKSSDPMTYEEKVEDTTVNYFYALVILSKCDSFMASGQCNGWDVVNSFNDGKFLRTWKYSELLNP